MLVDHITLTLSPNLALPDKHRTGEKDPQNKNKTQTLGTVSGKPKENEVEKPEVQAKAGGPQEEPKQSLAH